MDWVQDPHLQELLLKKASNARAAAREKSKLNQLEMDVVTPLYEGCRPEDTRLKVALMALEMKVKTQNDRRTLRRKHVILARTSSQREHVPDQFQGGEENRVLWIYRT